MRMKHSQVWDGKRWLDTTHLVEDSPTYWRMPAWAWFVLLVVPLPLIGRLWLDDGRAEGAVNYVLGVLGGAWLWHTFSLRERR